MDIDKKKATNLIKKILKIEKENLKTKKYNRSQMSDKIKKMIEEEVRKCY
ncbi:hypothetical protein [Selenihalanaerobacter shriftii]|uniref:Uncharacterized protein n=1 Tax=Selenihalanaerobacter shriftii TaxID=142842 RepID=A0A1T4NEV9_9FIRM|nr:hypothetical protein [Selenihalanaerobacter shriftii]SJZ77802.1 hypothetical protein SAMN02745118_01789 [Selenihalanaerobacter shriftii]